MARGSITPRPSKDGKRMSYRIKWESRGPDGTRRHHSATRSTKKEAERFLAEKLGQVTDGTFVAPNKETLGHFLERWLEIVRPDLAQSTAYGYACVIRARIVPHLGNVPLTQLDQLAVQQCYTSLHAAGYAPDTIKATHTVLHSALRQAVAWRLLQRNPADGVRVPGGTTKPPQTWNAEQAAAFLHATRRADYAALWRLGLDSGMRIGELLALAWQDVDLRTGVASVSRTLTHAPPGFRIGEYAKTASSRRAIVLGSDTIVALRGHRARQAARRLALGPHWTDLDLIFDRGDGTPYHPSTVRDAFERAVARAGLPSLTPHGMRHTMATVMLAAGVHPKVVQERLGHKSIQMTLDRYSHVSMTMQQDAAALLERILRDPSRPKRGHSAG